MFRFLHAADIHLDSPLRGLSRYEGAPVEELREATRKALTNLVSFALDEKVDLLVIAGDVYDGNWKDYNTGRYFLREMARLERAGIPVVCIAGNHDAQNKMTRQLRLPSNMTFCSADTPQTVLFEEWKVAVHGQSFADGSVVEDLSLGFPDPLSDYFNIGLLHTNADGRSEHDNYAPCSVAFLQRSGYDYWALGHIHQREILSESPWVVYSGNLQGRHAKEIGPKGATLVTVEDHRILSVDVVELDEIRWARLDIDLSELGTKDEFFTTVEDRLCEEQSKAGHRLIAFRVVTKGSSEVHNALVMDLEHTNSELRSMGDRLGIRVWFEKLRLESTPQRKKNIEDDILLTIVDAIWAKQDQVEELEALSKELFMDLNKKVPHAWKVGIDGFDPTAPDYLRTLIGDVVGLIEGGFRGVSQE